MRTSHWDEERIIDLLQQAEKGGVTVAELCHTRGVNENSFYEWRKYSSL